MIGLIPSELPYDLSETVSHVENVEARARAATSFIPAVDALGYVTRRWRISGEVEVKVHDFDWDRSHRSLPIQVFLEAFTFDEVLRLHSDEFVQSSISEWFQKEHPLLWKVENCMWQFGIGRDSSTLAWAVNGLKKLSTDLSDFSVTLTHTMFHHRWGPSEHEFELWIDAPLAIRVHYKGEHVLTCAFAIRKRGEVLVSQVQLRKKTGNRFLFKLKEHVLDFALGILARAFGADALWLTDGPSAIQAIRKAYGSTPCKMTPEDEVRIAALYDRPLAHYDREGDSMEIQGRVFKRLVPKGAARPLPAPKGRRPKKGRADSAHLGRAR
jgi:hypothetical protein